MLLVWKSQISIEIWLSSSSFVNNIDLLFIFKEHTNRA
nr:MAG TPA: hypothetical protein [Caudoviricetes sp.]